MVLCQRQEASSSSCPSGREAALAFGLDIRPPAQEADAASAVWSPDSADAAVHTIKISEEAFLLLCVLRGEGESDGHVVERALAGLDAYRIIEKALKARDLRKAFNATREMRRRGFGDETTTAMCRALFGAQSDKDLHSAFKLLDIDESGFIDKDELWNALPLMTEDIEEDRLEELFSVVDADGIGLIDFEEFATLVRNLNPNLKDRENPFSQFRKDTQGGLEMVGEVIGSAASSAWGATSALSTAFTADLPGISPLEMRKAGVVMQNMHKAGYSEKMATTVCRALFCEQSERQLQRAFKFYDTDRSDFLDAIEFRHALPLMGENVPEEEINERFRKAAVDESGNINFECFSKLVKSMNPKHKKKKKAGKEPEVVSLLKDAAHRVSLTWAQKTKEVGSQQAQEPEPKKKKGGRTSGSSRGSVSGSPAEPGITTAAGSGGHASAGRAITTLPPKSERVSVLRYTPSEQPQRASLRAPPSGYMF